MRIIRILTTLACFCPFALADLTPDQKNSDFLSLVALYAKNYGPYEVKRDVFGFDLYNVQPWLDQIKASKTDLDFYDICTRYIASLQDSHDEFTINSTWDAWLHFDGDIYDGKFLIDYIDRSYLLRSDYPFTVGDQLISVDGVAVSDLLLKFRPYAVNGASSPVSRDRLSAAFITERYQGWYPGATSISPTATIVVQRVGATSPETYSVSWDVSGTPVTTAGVVPSPVFKLGELIHSGSSRTSRRPAVEHLLRRKGTDAQNERLANPWGWREPEPDTVESTEITPAYLQPLLQLQNMSAAKMSGGFTELSGLSPFGSIFPVFSPPAGFTLRLGSKSTDFFLSAVYPSGTNKIGLIRIPTMSPSSTAAALTQFASEIAYMQQNTDGLVVDVMANGGGSICYTQSLAGYLMTNTYRGAAEELRATLNWQASFGSSLQAAISAKAPQYVIDLYRMYLSDISTALTQNRARTGSLPLCGTSFDVPVPKNSSGAIAAYTKPIVVLTDNFTLSAGEMFTMFLQDAGRAPIFGMRTDGGGGNVVSYPNAAPYSEGNVRITQGLITRANPVQVPGFPSLPYYDGVGIQPEMTQDYMTASNLGTGGMDFVNAFTKAINDLIAQSKK